MVIEQCKHTVTNGLICVDCGVKVLEVETRPCKDCAHHKRLSDGSICKKHLMAIVPDMLVTFYVDKGTCFEVVAPSEEVKQSFDGSVQFELDFGRQRIRVNCPDEDSDIYIHVKDGKQYAGLSLSLDQAEEIANYILGHVKNARISNH